jgi:hypothetical protein
MPYQVAKDVISYCTSCKRNLVHVIVALNGEKIARVLCRSCKKEHAYHPSKGVKEASTKKRTSKTSPVKKAEKTLKAWQTALEKCNSLPGKVYSLTGLFDDGDKIDHGTFGMGVVNKLIKPNKMEVLFEEGTKILIRGSD